MELFKLIIDFLVSLCLLGGYIITGYVLYLAYTTGNPFSYIMFFVLLFFALMADGVNRIGRKD